MVKKFNKKENELSIAGRNFKKVAGLFAILAGALYTVIQFIHPPEILTSVSSSSWQIVACLSILMSLSFIIGNIGVYMKQVEVVGWSGLIGFIIFNLFWLISMTFSFIEAFVYPLLINEAPKFVEGMLGLFGENRSEINLGVFTILAPIAGILYMLGGLLLGIAMYRAKVFPRFTGILLSFAAVVTLATAIIPHPYDRILALPMGAVFVWLGYILWFDTNSILKTNKI
ncbi:MAG: hypothetical protein ABS935_08580 [Solibacillus sp.]|uniref:hypothetical protein n=1 Tax=Solibacillus sp. TaxID=1909654 RepID=UPI003315F23C